MCDPASAIGFGLSAASQVAGFGAKQHEIDNYNAAAKQNAINASLAATNQYTGEQRKLSADITKANMEGYKAEMGARQAAGTAKASGGSSGIDVRSLSMNSILNDLTQQNAFNQAKVQTNRENYEDRYREDVKGIEAQAQGRINAMPFKEDASPLGMALGIATSGFDSFKSTKTGKNWLGIE